MPDLELLHRMYDEFARYHGHDPSKGPWVLIVRCDGTSSLEVFEKPEDAWCCLDPERIAAVVQTYPDDLAAGARPEFKPIPPLSFDPKGDRSVWWEGKYGSDDDE